MQQWNTHTPCFVCAFTNLENCNWKFSFFFSSIVRSVAWIEFIKLFHNEAIMVLSPVVSIRVLTVHLFALHTCIYIHISIHRFFHLCTMCLCHSMHSIASLIWLFTIHGISLNNGFGCFMILLTLSHLAHVHCFTVWACVSLIRINNGWFNKSSL